MSATNIVPFTFDTAQVRVVMKDGEPWFVAADVAKVLDIGRTDDAVRRLDEEDRGADTIRTPGGPQEMAIINESGLYSLIFTSRKPEAKRFKRWVTGEVLPSIRKTGGYGTAELSAGDREFLARLNALHPDQQEVVTTFVLMAQPPLSRADARAIQRASRQAMTALGVLAAAAKRWSGDAWWTVDETVVVQETGQDPAAIARALAWLAERGYVDVERNGATVRVRKGPNADRYRDMAIAIGDQDRTLLRPPLPPAVSFAGTVLGITEIDGQIWFRADQVGLALGYRGGTLRQTLFRHRDRFQAGDITLAPNMGGQEIRLLSPNGIRRMLSYGNPPRGAAFLAFLTALEHGEVPEEPAALPAPAVDPATIRLVAGAVKAAPDLAVDDIARIVRFAQEQGGDGDLAAKLAAYHRTLRED